MQRCHLGFDVGTSSSKGVLVSEDGRLLRSATREHTVHRPADGHVEADPEVWWRELLDVAVELTGPGDAEVVSVGVSGMGPCVVLTDEVGTVLRPAILYGVDTRASCEIVELDDELGREAVLQRCGSVLSSQAVGPKLRWLARHEPEVWRGARRMHMPASFLVERLTGAYVLDRHSASQCTPMFDRWTEEWAPDWAPLVAGHLQLPELRWAGEEAGRTREEVAGIPAGVPVTVGTIDAWSEALSVGAHRVGDLMLMYGTTMFLVATVPEPVTSEVMWGTSGVLPGTRCLAGGMAASGALTAWVREIAGGTAYPTLLAEAAASGPGARGLLALPYFGGERTPVADPRARGTILGLDLTHTRGDLYRAVLEATAFGVRHNVESMLAAGVDVRRVVAVGGGTQGGLWTQIVSDVTGLEQVLPGQTIGAAYGAAFLAAGLLGSPDIDRWNPPARTVEPDGTLRERYDRLYDLYLRLYPATRELTHELVELTHPREAGHRVDSGDAAPYLSLKSITPSSGSTSGR